MRVEVTAENYNFKRMMQQYIIDNLQPLLFSNNFLKYGNNKYVRETDRLVQLILLKIEVDRLKAYAMYLPIFLPYDNILSYGIELTGSSGIELLGGKYFTTIYETEKFDPYIQFQHYNSQHLENLHKLILSIKEGVLPEMDATSSLDLFMDRFRGEEIKFFNHNFCKAYQNNDSHRFITGVYSCIKEQFDRGKSELENLQDSLKEKEIRDYIKRLLLPLQGKAVPDQKSFLTQFEVICNERRHKYKLLK